MTTDRGNDAGPVDPEKKQEANAIQETRISQWLHWVQRALPVVFLVFVAILAARELHALDLHAVRAVLQTLTLPQVLLIQLVALAGVLIMCLYDWHAARTFEIRLPLHVLVRNAWIANAFNNLVGLSGLAGSGIRLLLLGRAKVETRRATAFSALIMASVPAGLSVLSWPSLLTGGPVISQLPVSAWMAWLALGAFALYVPLYIVTLYKGMFARLLHGLTAQPATSLAAMIAISTLDWLFASTVAWIALQMSGAAIPWPQFLSAFVLASTLGIL